MTGESKFHRTFRVTIDVIADRVYSLRYQGNPMLSIYRGEYPNGQAHVMAQILETGREQIIRELRLIRKHV